MAKVIVAFSKPEDAKRIRNILVKNGFEVAEVCTCGAQAIQGADRLGSGILVCGGRFSDMVYGELCSCLPPGFSMLVIASLSVVQKAASGSLVCLGLPLRVHDLISTLEMMEELSLKKQGGRKGPPRRSSKEQEFIGLAKELLMERNQMTEAQAHKYIQKCSMDSGRGLVETARMIISLLDR